jgi:hypothetical protein
MEDDIKDDDDLDLKIPPSIEKDEILDGDLESPEVVDDDEEVVDKEDTFDDKDPI